MSYYSEPDSNIRDKVKLVLNLSNYATKKNQNMLQDLADKKDFIALKAEAGKLDINKLLMFLLV